MAKVLTDAATVECSHVGPDGKKGKVAAQASQQVLTVDGHAVLVGSDLVGKPITACPLTGPNTVPCTATSSMTPGTVAKLRAGGHAVLLEGAAGTTNSSPPGTWTATSAGQTKLDASENQGGDT
jgi:hypothetical protein